jgi:hypothetical protein
MKYFFKQNSYYKNFIFFGFLKIPFYLNDHKLINDGSVIENNNIENRVLNNNDTDFNITSSDNPSNSTIEDDYIKNTFIEDKIMIRSKNKKIGNIEEVSFSKESLLHTNIINFFNGNDSLGGDFVYYLKDNCELLLSTSPSVFQEYLINKNQRDYINSGYLYFNNEVPQNIPDYIRKDIKFLYNYEEKKYLCCNGLLCYLKDKFFCINKKRSIANIVSTTFIDNRCKKISTNNTNSKAISSLYCNSDEVFSGFYVKGNMIKEELQEPILFNNEGCIKFELSSANGKNIIDYKNTFLHECGENSFCGEVVLDNKGMILSCLKTMFKCSYSTINTFNTTLCNGGQKKIINQLTPLSFFNKVAISFFDITGNNLLKNRKFCSETVWPYSTYLPSVCGEENPFYNSLSIFLNIKNITDISMMESFINKTESMTVDKDLYFESSKNFSLFGYITDIYGYRGFSPFYNEIDIKDNVKVKKPMRIEPGNFTDFLTGYINSFNGFDGEQVVKQLNNNLDFFNGEMIKQGSANMTLQEYTSSCVKNGYMNNEGEITVTQACEKNNIPGICNGILDTYCNKIKECFEMCLQKNIFYGQINQYAPKLFKELSKLNLKFLYKNGTTMSDENITLFNSDVNQRSLVLNKDNNIANITEIDFDYVLSSENIDMGLSIDFLDYQNVVYLHNYLETMGPMQYTGKGFTKNFINDSVFIKYNIKSGVNYNYVNEFVNIHCPYSLVRICSADLKDSQKQACNNYCQTNVGDKISKIALALLVLGCIAIIKKILSVFTSCFGLFNTSFLDGYFSEYLVYHINRFIYKNKICCSKKQKSKNKKKKAPSFKESFIHSLFLNSLDFRNKLDKEKIVSEEDSLELLKKINGDFIKEKKEELAGRIIQHIDICVVIYKNIYKELKKKHFFRNETIKLIFDYFFTIPFFLVYLSYFSIIIIYDPGNIQNRLMIPYAAISLVLIFFVLIISTYILSNCQQKEDKIISFLKVKKNNNNSIAGYVENVYEVILTKKNITTFVDKVVFSEHNTRTWKLFFITCLKALAAAIFFIIFLLFIIDKILF